MPYFTNENRKIHYRAIGEGPLILFLPGNTASSASHLEDLSYFGQYFQAVSIDFWGTGLSDRVDSWPEEWWNIAARDSARLIEVMGKDSAIIVGCSGGGAVALLMAQIFPSKVEAVIVDSVLEFYPPELIDAIVKDRNSKTECQAKFWSAAHGDDWEQVVDADCELILKLRNSKHLFSERMDEIHCPVLLAGSLKDEFLPDLEATMTSMSKRINDCDLCLINEGGHPLMWTCREKFRTAVMSFLQKKGIR